MIVQSTLRITCIGLAAIFGMQMTKGEDDQSLLFSVGRGVKTPKDCAKVNAPTLSFQRFATDWVHEAARLHELPKACLRDGKNTDCGEMPEKMAYACHAALASAYVAQESEQLNPHLYNSTGNGHWGLFGAIDWWATHSNHEKSYPEGYGYLCNIQEQMVQFANFLGDENCGTYGVVEDKKLVTGLCQQEPSAHWGGVCKGLYPNGVAVPNKISEKIEKSCTDALKDKDSPFKHPCHCDAKSKWNCK